MFNSRVFPSFKRWNLYESRQAILSLIQSDAGQFFDLLEETTRDEVPAFSGVDISRKDLSFRVAVVERLDEMLWVGTRYRLSPYVIKEVELEIVLKKEDLELQGQGFAHLQRLFELGLVAPFELIDRLELSVSYSLEVDTFNQLWRAEHRHRLSPREVFPDSKLDRPDLEFWQAALTEDPPSEMLDEAQAELDRIVEGSEDAHQSHR